MLVLRRGRSGLVTSTGGFRRVTAVSGEFRREIDAIGEVFVLLEAFADDQEIDEKTAFCIQLVAEELFTNMVRHNQGGGDRITVTIDRHGNSIHLELVDVDVEPFDPETAEIPPVDAGIEERRPGGLGIYLVKKMVDDLDYDYETEGRRMRISVTKTLEN
jgi:anti-sigma regulatory factor (Ser/Thr protein kinase)